jgi:flagellar assembly protein FliH
MKPSSTDPPVPGPQTPSGQGSSPQAATDADGGAGVRVVRFDRPLRTGADSIGWADPRIAQRIEQAAQQARQEAHGLGYAAGWAQGRKAATERAQAEEAERAAAAAAALRERSARTRTLLTTLGEAARQAALAAVPAWNEVADAVAEGALAIARAALGRELAAVDAEVADAVRTALRTLAGADEVTVHVHPGDLSLLREIVGDQLPEHVRLSADPGVRPGGVVAETPVQRLRRDLPAALARAEEVLRS